MQFTTRPELQGTFGMVASTHWIATAVGMKLLEAGGSAADAAVGAGLTLNVVEPHLNGPLGDLPLLVWAADAPAPDVLCGQGVAPSGATIAHYRAQGLDLIPGSGLLAAVTPGAWDAWMLLLQRYGRLPLRQVMEPALHYARAGHPLLPRVSEVIGQLADFFVREWPSSAAVWMPGGQVPRAGALFANPALAAFWDRLLTEAEAVPGRAAQIARAREVFAQGFVAEAIDSYLAGAEVMDAEGARRKGVLTGQDMAGWRASWEPPVTTAHKGWDVFKPGFWSQGPVLLQALNMLRRHAMGRMDPSGDGFVHAVTEALKLSLADRDSYYGDPAQADIPLGVLLSLGYGASRGDGIGAAATQDFRPGHIEGYEDQARRFRDRIARLGTTPAGAGAGAPPVRHPAARAGDTVHLDVVDAEGLMISATPSGGWLQSNPVVPGLGVPLGTRAQMFWLEDGLPTSLAPGRRPRTTLSPSMARAPDGTRLAFGTPGGDQQDQWQLTFLLRLIHHGQSLQQAIDGPLFHTAHLQSSFHPRTSRAGHLIVEPSLGGQTIARLRARGHEVEVAEPWSIGRLTAVSRAPDGLMRAAATPRLMQAYAAGR